MPETAASVIRDALELILVQDAEAPLAANEVQSAIRMMNRMMDRLAAEGVSLGYTKVENLGSALTVPDGALEGIVYNLALSVAPLFLNPNEDVPASLRLLAKNSLATMRIISSNIDPSSFPNTLPIGSGNEGSNSLYAPDHFYTNDNEGTLAENNQPILVEDNTVEDISGS